MVFGCMVCFDSFFFFLNVVLVLVVLGGFDVLTSFCSSCTVFSGLYVLQGCPE